MLDMLKHIVIVSVCVVGDGQITLYSVFKPRGVANLFCLVQNNGHRIVVPQLRNRKWKKTRIVMFHDPFCVVHHACLELGYLNIKYIVFVGIHCVEGVAKQDIADKRSMNISGHDSLSPPAESLGRWLV